MSADEATRPTVGFDHFDPDTAADPHRAYDDLRARCPVAYTPSHGGFWVLTNRADLHAVANDWETFSSEQVIIARPAAVNQSDESIDAMFLTMDPPRHEQFRRPIQPWFSPGQIRPLEPGIRAAANSLIDAFAEDGKADFGMQYARPLTKSMIAQLFAISVEDMNRFADLAYESMSPDADVAQRGHVETAKLLFELIDERRRNLGSDVLSGLITMHVDGHELSDPEISRAAYVLLGAGYETTMSVIANSLWYLATHPDLRAELAATPSFDAGVVEEFIRLLAPLSSARTARKDVVVGDQQIRRGEKIMMLFPAANRDPAEFDRPNEFVPDRVGNRHLSFGSGVHRCIGMHLARLEIRVALEEMLRRIPDFELDPDREILWSFGRSQAWGAAQLPVIFPPSAA